MQSLLRLSIHHLHGDYGRPRSTGPEPRVASFATDNNGVIVELPAVSGAEATVSGSLIFGILGTQSNNGLGKRNGFWDRLQFGNFMTTYQSAEYESFLDSGSNGIYFSGFNHYGFTCLPYEMIFNYLWYHAPPLRRRSPC